VWRSKHTGRSKGVCSATDELGEDLQERMLRARENLIKKIFITYTDSHTPNKFD